jgi:hypothetical protein
MYALFHTAIAAAAMALAVPALAQITFYEHEGFRGRVHTTRGALDSFAGWDFNDRASSVIVETGRWEVCDEVGFKGRCAVLSPGSYDRLASMGLNDRLASVRPATSGARHDNEAAPPMRRPNYDYRQRPRENLFEATVTSVRAVFGPPERRCWIERQPEERQPEREVTPTGRGVIGHQIGTSPLRRCGNVVDAEPAYWDVGYTYRGNAHHIQMSQPPGQTVTVNRNGEPRM